MGLYFVTPKTDNFIWELIYLAAGSAVLGIVLAFIVVFVCQHYDIDIYKNFWILLIPVTLAILLNICFIELYRKYKKNQK